jgi:hypothetical protein
MGRRGLLRRGGASSATRHHRTASRPFRAGASHAGTASSRPSPRVRGGARSAGARVAPRGTRRGAHRRELHRGAVGRHPDRGDAGGNDRRGARVRGRRADARAVVAQVRDRGAPARSPLIARPTGMRDAVAQIRRSTTYSQTRSSVESAVDSGKPRSSAAASWPNSCALRSASAIAVELRTSVTTSS